MLRLQLQSLSPHGVRPMKKAFLIALSLSLPAFASSDFDSEDLSVDVDPEELVSQEAADASRPPLLQFCWNLHYTSCSGPGTTQQCTDGIWSDYVCTCRTLGTRNVWVCPEVR
ncbi:hypothetical protein MXAN_0605 [Myxococcus xanthus DK 1622]|uniref:Uncharacterized protein n=2 Tax=Myxococcaceae TaxID=31 RepID=Q1DEQ0_MYXXD|nr:hypothetical protein MXAN_0605 [Myxococcus xanthus DK 1622]NOJ55666.1 hypothetical protein [Myxococcus xanthus]QPM80297.1 hypothetical protein I5Q59_03085 [Myxococcus xanthus]QVW69361.1 hypothetical protein JTM82_07375 [Myxococcus xanthus DZ2]UEO04514.1 hypothetical protein K1515_35440 [Myxococcus xanthus DZ2]